MGKPAPNPHETPAREYVLASEVDRLRAQRDRVVDALKQVFPLCRGYAWPANSNDRVSHKASQAMASAIAACQDKDLPGVTVVTPTREILTEEERRDFGILIAKAADVANGLDRWMQDHLASAFPPDEETESGEVDMMKLGLLSAACIALAACVTGSFDQAYEKAYLFGGPPPDYRGVVLHLHGCDGSDPLSDWTDFLTDQGFAIVKIESFADPRPPESCFPPYPNNLAIRQLRKRQAEYALDQIRLDYPGKPVFIWGHSEGGYVTNMLSMDGVAGAITTGAPCGGLGLTRVPKETPLLMLIGKHDRYMKPPLRRTALNLQGSCALVAGRSPNWNYLIVDQGHWVRINTPGVRETVLRLLSDTDG